MTQYAIIFNYTNIGNEPASITYYTFKDGIDIINEWTLHEIEKSAKGAGSLEGLELNYGDSLLLFANFGIYHYGESGALVPVNDYYPFSIGGCCGAHINTLQNEINNFQQGLGLNNTPNTIYQGRFFNGTTYNPATYFTELGSYYPSLERDGVSVYITNQYMAELSPNTAGMDNLQANGNILHLAYSFGDPHKGLAKITCKNN